jgi:hypothetical protein
MKDTEALIRRTHPNARVLPIILYHDGVQVGSYSTVKAVLGTCGLFSDELQRKAKAKFSIGYITDIKNLPLEPLVSHLTEVAKMNKTSALEEIKLFVRHLENEFWKLVLAPIKEHYARGISLKMLGDNTVHHMIPVVPFLVGDDPAQHDISGVLNGHASRPCTFCTFRPKSGIAYTETGFPNRNAAEIKVMCEIVEDIHSRKNTFELHRIENNLEVNQRKSSSKFKLDDFELEQISGLANSCVQPLVNAFHSAPMGAFNHIYSATPPDPFHVMPAGLMKHAVFWIVTVIVSMPKIDKHFLHGPAIFDQRLSNYPSMANLPHVPNIKFLKGLSRIATQKTSNEQANATGPGDGYRSSWWITALLQIYFGIGYFSDVLPNRSPYGFTVQYDVEVEEEEEEEDEEEEEEDEEEEDEKAGDRRKRKAIATNKNNKNKKKDKNKKTVKRRRVEEVVSLGNPTAKVFNAIYSILDVYFQCKQTNFSTQSIKKLSDDIAKMNAHLKLLWDLKQATLRAPLHKKMTVRKNHTIVHLPAFAAKFGALSKFNGETWEESHRQYTTSTFYSTSRRNKTLLREMLNKNKQKCRSYHMGHVEGMMKAGTDYLRALLPSSAPEELVFKNLNNVAYWTLALNETKTEFFIPLINNDDDVAGGGAEDDGAEQQQEEEDVLVVLSEERRLELIRLNKNKRAAKKKNSKENSIHVTKEMHKLLHCYKILLYSQTIVCIVIIAN